ncbi:hypothetical protein DFJ43DRAFT_1035470, partial [Lentinula guzmanii]
RNFESFFACTITAPFACTITAPSRAPSRPPSRTSKTNTLSSSHASSGQAMQVTQNTSSGSTPAPSTKTRRKTILATDDPNKDSFYPEQMKKLILRAKQLFAGENIVVESGYLVEYRANILTLLYRDLKYTQYNEEESPSSNGIWPQFRDKADIIIGKVEDLLSHENFLRDGFDELPYVLLMLPHPGKNKQHCPSWPAGNSSITILQGTGLAYPVAQLFPESFSNSIPQVALALTMAVVRNCIEEYEMGIGGESCSRLQGNGLKLGGNQLDVEIARRAQAAALYGINMVLYSAGEGGTLLMHCHVRAEAEFDRNVLCIQKHCGSYLIPAYDRQLLRIRKTSKKMGSYIDWVSRFKYKLNVHGLPLAPT